MSPDSLEVLARLRDERSGRVIFVSHCLLNENTRYAGGAFRPGAVSELVADLVGSGAGIYQMPCPEQRAWGGVLKRHMVLAYGSNGSLLYRFRRPLLRGFVWWTRFAYRRMARQVARDIADYRGAGFEVVGVIGVGGSPSCGVTTTLDLKRSFDVVASCPLAQISRALMNERAVSSCLTAGEGLFIRALKRELARRGLVVPFLEHDLVAEMHGRRQTVLEPEAETPAGDSTRLAVGRRAVADFHRSHAQQA